MSENDWIALWLSKPRWERYLRACGSDSKEALELYEWNLQLAGAIMHDIAHIEVAVRNTYDRTITSLYDSDTHWLFDANSPVLIPLWRNRKGRKRDLNTRNRKSICDAKQRVRSQRPAPGQVIAELPFGFWRHLTDTAHEKTLWVPYLNRAFPKGTDRKQVEQWLGLINEVRNRASHHEPLFTPDRRDDLIEAQHAIVTLARMLLPELAGYIQATSNLEKTLEAR